MRVQGQADGGLPVGASRPNQVGLLAVAKLLRPVGGTAVRGRGLVRLATLAGKPCSHTPLWVVPVALLLVAAVPIGVIYHLDQAVHGGSGTLRCECKSKARTEYGWLLGALAAGHALYLASNSALAALGVAISLVPGCLLSNCECSRLAEPERRALAWRLTQPW